MEAVVYSTFRNQLKTYMKKVNDDFDSLLVVNKNPQEDIVVLSKDTWDSIQETLSIYQNQYLAEKIIRGIEEVKHSKVVKHDLIEVEDDVFHEGSME